MYRMLINNTTYVENPTDLVNNFDQFTTYFHDALDSIAYSKKEK
jgi:hypothetical protein